MDQRPQVEGTTLEGLGPASIAGQWQRRGAKFRLSDTRLKLLAAWGERIVGGASGVTRWEHNTFRYRLAPANALCYQLFNTMIVRIEGNRVMLMTGGFRSSITMRRMNDILRQEGFPFGLFVERRTWFVGRRKTQDPQGWTTWPFVEGIVLYRNGRVRGAPSMAVVLRRRANAERMIRKYLKHVRQELTAKDWPEPDAGDCMYCSLSEKGTGRSWGDIAGDIGHLVLHMRERVVSGSLLFRAVQNRYHPEVMLPVLRDREDVKTMMTLLGLYLRKRIMPRLDRPLPKE